MSRILKADFRYTTAAKTDISKTFRRVRAELKAKAEQEAADKAEREAKVKPLVKAKVA